MPATEKVLVLYCYYEKNTLYQENLQYFLKHGLDDDHDYVFIINGGISVAIPEKPNITIIKRHNSDFDFGAYSAAINTLQNHDKYGFFFFINTSVRGPFLPPYYKQRWVDPFLDLFRDNNEVKLVGTTINILNTMSKETRTFKSLMGYDRPYTHVQSQMFAMDRECLDYLIQKEFFKQKAERNFMKFIALREILMSQLVLRNGWNVSCLIPEYKHNDFRNVKTDINPSSRNGDPNFPNACFNRTIHPYEVIFIKTNRLISDKETLSLSNEVHKSNLQHLTI
jgi:hypothetical protein